MHIKKHLSFSALRKSLSSHFSQVDDSRQQGKIEFEMHDCLMSGFAMTLFQAPSLCAFQRRIEDIYQRSNLHSMFDIRNIPKDSQMRDLLDTISPESLEPIFSDFLGQIQRGRHLEKYQVLGGKYLIPIDGSEYFSSNKISCPSCLTQRKRAVSAITTISFRLLSFIQICARCCPSPRRR